MPNTPPSTFQSAYPGLMPALVSKFEQADALRQAINSLKGASPPLWQTIVARLRTDWTYHSCGIEGSTLTRDETHFFLSEGLTVEGKPFKDFLDAKNHAEGVDLLFDVVANQRPVSEGLIKELNALLLHGVSHTPARTPAGHRVQKPAHPGLYKSAPNHVQKADGTIHHYVEPLHVQSEMEQLCGWINGSLERLHPILISAVAHYNMVRIHPFDDGNGRGARLLMNLVLLHKGYFPAVVRVEAKRQYLQALNDADNGNLAPFVSFIADAVITTNESVLEVLEGKSVTRAGLAASLRE